MPTAHQELSGILIQEYSKYIQQNPPPNNYRLHVDNPAIINGKPIRSQSILTLITHVQSYTIIYQIVIELDSTTTRNHYMRGLNKQENRITVLHADPNSIQTIKDNYNNWTKELVTLHAELEIENQITTSS